ncbi:hypothetical protein L596_011408 [Steinernema carpocapsae]|uniref:Uncharacterized protein n=1 Tax=Steinernema carpocapsae TaxID=34508 RepID=A0A4U5NTS9_STECR|nr:hypothetical protein L596_011408 [Steinernema carpocapsae]
MLETKLCIRIEHQLAITQMRMLPKNRKKKPRRTLRQKNEFKPKAINGLLRTQLISRNFMCDLDGRN